MSRRSSPLWLVVAGMILGVIAVVVSAGCTPELREAVRDAVCECPECGAQPSWLSELTEALDRLGLVDDRTDRP